MRRPKLTKFSRKGRNWNPNEIKTKLEENILEMMRMIQRMGDLSIKIKKTREQLAFCKIIRSKEKKTYEGSNREKRINDLMTITKKN